MADPQIKAILRGLNRLGEKVVSKITLDLTANLIEATPVDVGWARSNWVPAIGTPFITNLRGVEATSANAAAAKSRQDNATSVIATGYKLAMGNVFVSNNVPYIGRLNDGSSNQEPAGFVQRAIAKAVTVDIRGLGS